VSLEDSASPYVPGSRRLLVSQCDARWTLELDSDFRAIGRRSGDAATPPVGLNHEDTKGCGLTGDFFVTFVSWWFFLACFGLRALLSEFVP